MKRRFLHGDQVLDKWVELHGEASVKDMYNNCDFYFFEYDHDSDNHLSIEEADPFLDDFSQASNRPKQDLFLVCDVDEDGLLNQHEFRAAFLMSEMMLSDFLRIEEFLELRPQYRNQRTRGKRRDKAAEPDVSHRYTSSRSDKWVGKEVEVRWLYNTVRKRYRWESAKVEERNRDGTYRVFFSGDAYPEDGIEEKNIRQVSKGTLRLIIVGPPNTGEEIQMAHLVRKYKIVHLKFEDLLHKAINSGSPKETIDVEDMIQILQDKIESSECAERGFLITDFPTSAIEARDLDGMLGALSLTHVLHMKVPFEQLKQRMTPTAGEQNEKERDKNLRAQMQRFDSQMMPVLNFYETKGLVREVYADCEDEDEIWQRVQAAILRNESEEEEFRSRKKKESEMAAEETGDHPIFPKLLPLDGEEEPMSACEACSIQ